ncbi:MAG: SIR2 family protein, partial [Pedobacter sp.]
KIIADPNGFPLLRFIQYLLSTADKKLTIVTTNYDRLGEYAASLAKAVICTGYAQNYMGHFSAQIHTNKFSAARGFNGQVDIWKVHGSLDWFKNAQDENFQLPLRHKKPEGFTPLIVTPGLSKYSETHMEPYRTIFAQADNAIAEANGFFCLGYGFNDAHVQPKLIAEIKNNKPIVVLTKQLTPKTKQSIIDNGCKNYILFEEAPDGGTQVFSSSFGDFIIPGQSTWVLEEYLKLIIS